MDSLPIAGGFLLLFGLAGAAWFFLRRGGAAVAVRFPWKTRETGPSTIQRPSWLVLNAQNSLHSVEWRGGHYLLAVHPRGIHVVDRQCPPGFERTLVHALKPRSPVSGEALR